MIDSKDRMKVTKAEIVENIYERVHIDRRDVQDVIDAFIDELNHSLIEDKIIELRGFGTFEVKLRKGRSNSRNPKTGEPVKVSPHGVAVFRPGKNLKAAVRQLYERST